MMQATHPVTIVDMEAGLEHLSRGTSRHVDTLLVVLEPYYKALEIGRRAVELGRELGVPRVIAVVNKVRDAGDAAAVRDYATAHGLPLSGEVPLDDALRRGDLEGRAPIDIEGSPAVAAIVALVPRLLAAG